MRNFISESTWAIRQSSKRKHTIQRDLSVFRAILWIR